MYASASPSEKIFVGTVNGVTLVERDGPGSWRVSRTGLEGSQIHALVIEPESGVLFAGVRKGGVYVSADDGRTWEQRKNGLTQENIYSLCAVRVAGKARVYAGTEPAHLFVSEDLGQTWTELPALRAIESLPDWDFPAPPYDAHVKILTCDPNNQERMYACVEQGCLLRSEDGGHTWTAFYGVDEDAHRVAIHPTKPEVVYLTTGNGLYFTDNGGKVWKHITPRTLRIGYPDPILLHPTEEGLMFIAGSRHGPEVWYSTHVADSTFGRSRDGGKSWEFSHNGLPEVIHGNIASMVLETHAKGYDLYACGTDGDLFYSNDGGDRWTTIVSGLAPLSKGGHHIILKRPTEPALAATAK